MVLNYVSNRRLLLIGTPLIAGYAPSLGVFLSLHEHVIHHAITSSLSIATSCLSSSSSNGENKNDDAIKSSPTSSWSSSDSSSSGGATDDDDDDEETMTATFITS